jgi:hypothetical protein
VSKIGRLFWADMKGYASDRTCGKNQKPLPRRSPGWRGLFSTHSPRITSQRFLQANEMKKKSGRPRKTKGVIAYHDFARAGIVMSQYDEARSNGQKHSVAVAQSVEFIRLRFPKMRISETVVKRILAECRPRKSQSILRFERSTLTEEELAKFSWVQQLLGALQKKGLKLPTSSDVSLPKSVTTFKIRFGERPNYPRHNRKT